MARYQLRRPTYLHVLASAARRQEAGLGSVGPGSEEEGPESPASPTSSPSTTGVPSPADSSDSEDDEPPSPKESGADTLSQAAPISTSTALSSIIPTTSSPQAVSTAPSQAFTLLSSTATTSASSSTSTSVLPPAFSQAPTSQGIGAVAPPQATDPATTTITTIVASSAQTVSTTPPASQASSTLSTSSTSPAISVSQVLSTKIARPTQPIPSSSPTSSLAPPSRTGLPVGEEKSPQRTRPEPTLMSKGAEAAAITLSIIGAIALAVCILIYCKRRRRRRNEKLEAELERDAANYAAMQAPDAAHLNSRAVSADRPHMTQISDRSNTLFGSSSYSRPETVSTHDGSHIAMAHRTPNPFADPPLNKAYDVLAGRPRSTTLTDRGSWIRNPFKDPESERFDPFGELQARARRERVKQVEIARREAELERQSEAKEKMGLMPPQRIVERKGSGVTLEGMGVLDRSNGGGYR